MNMERRFWVWIVGSLESSASWKHDKTQDRNRSASICAVVDSSLYTYLQAWVRPTPHPGGDGAPAVGGGGLQIWTKKGAGKVGQGNSDRAVIGFCRKRLLEGLGCTEFQETWLHRTRFPASFLWWGMACRASAGRRQKILPWRSRILGLVAFQEIWLHRTRFPASFLWWGIACKVWAGHKQKILPRRNRILGKWLFRRLAVGNTIKTLGFRNVLWESGPWKNFLKVLCPARNLRESGSFGKVSYYKVWP